MNDAYLQAILNLEAVDTGPYSGARGVWSTPAEGFQDSNMLDFLGTIRVG